MLNMPNVALTRAFLRSHRLELCAGWAVAICLVTALVPVDPQAVPFRVGVTTEAWPLLLALTPAGISASLVAPHPEMVGSLPRPTWVTRSMTAGVLATLTIGPVAITCLVINRPADMAIRNVCICLALAVATALVAGASMAWIPPVAVVAITWLYGKDDRGQPRNWGLLTADSDVRALVITVLLAALLMALWVIRGSRHNRDELISSP